MIATSLDNPTAWNHEASELRKNCYSSIRTTVEQWRLPVLFCAMPRCMVTNWPARC
jgi:hypothetical protein